MKKECLKLLRKMLLVIVLLSVAGCARVRRAAESNALTVVGSGNIVSQAREVSSFDSVEASLSFDLTILQGEEFSIIFIADDNFVDYLAAEITGSTLTFGLKDGYAYDISNVTMGVEVTVPDLTRLSLNGSSRATLDDFHPIGPFEIALTGSSHVGGELVSKNVVLDVDGNSTVQLSGSGDHLRLEGCGSSVADLRAFEVNDAELDMACSSTAILQVDDRLDVEAAQKARVFYTRRPASGDINTYEGAYVGQEE